MAMMWKHWFIPFNLPWNTGRNSIVMFLSTCYVIANMDITRVMNRDSHNRYFISPLQRIQMHVRFIIKNYFHRELLKPISRVKWKQHLRICCRNILILLKRNKKLNSSARRKVIGADFILQKLMKYSNRHQQV